MISEPRTTWRPHARFSEPAQEKGTQENRGLAAVEHLANFASHYPWRAAFRAFLPPAHEKKAKNLLIKRAACRMGNMLPYLRRFDAREKGAAGHGAKLLGETASAQVFKLPPGIKEGRTSTAVAAVAQNVRVLCRLAHNVCLQPAVTRLFFVVGKGRKKKNQIV
jgi:hypothetical protein